MAQYTSPFLVLNLGSEILFVISQRLRAQNVSPDRCARVLDEITSALISQDFFARLTKPQPTLTPNEVKHLLGAVAQSSEMKLDPVSMDRLWDLVTMVYKWQTTMSSDVIAVTHRHLYETETFAIKPDTQLHLHKVQNFVDNFSRITTPSEKVALRESILLWLRDCNVRVALLIRMGLQNDDASFVANNIDSKASEMLKNLGENIYAVTEGYDKRGQKPDLVDCSDLDLLVSQILGTQKKTLVETKMQIKLSADGAQKMKHSYSKIDVHKKEDIFEVDTDNNIDTDADSVRDDLLRLMNDKV